MGKEKKKGKLLENKKLFIVILVVGLLLVAVLVGYLLGRGKTFSIQLEGNATTGYEWVCALSKDGIIKEVSKEYKSDNKEELVGAPGVWTFKFKALKQGEVVLTCEYERPFEEDSSIETRIYPLEIDKNLNVKELK